MISIIFTMKSGKEIWCTPVPVAGKELTLLETLKDVQNGFDGMSSGRNGVLTMFDQNGDYIVILSSEMAAAVIKEHAEDSYNLS